ncbi:MAG: hypothetical protein ACPL4K_05765 [Candidatus Margulisiibacteriota bacterium]
MQPKKPLGRIRLEIAIHRLPVSSEVKIRSPKSRADYRALRFRHFFKGAKEREMSLRRISISYKLGEPKDYQNLLVSLDDEKGEVLSLGIVKEISWTKKHILVLTPLAELERVKRIQLSGYWLNF